MRIIGLTGGLSSGKTTVASLLKKKGAKVLNADDIAHRVLSGKGRCREKIVQVFGKNILTGNKIDRKKLGGIVFKDRAKLQKLERVIHPFVIQDIENEIRILRWKKKGKLVVLDVPLLFESGLHRLADVVVVVRASQNQQVRRAVKKLKISKSEALARIKAQMPLYKKIRMADFVVDNRKNLNQTKNQVDELWQKLLQKTKK